MPYKISSVMGFKVSAGMVEVMKIIARARASFRKEIVIFMVCFSCGFVFQS